MTYHLASAPFAADDSITGTPSTRSWHRTRTSASPLQKRSGPVPSMIPTAFAPGRSSALTSCTSYGDRTEYVAHPGPRTDSVLRCPFTSTIWYPSPDTYRRAREADPS